MMMGMMMGIRVYVCVLLSFSVEDADYVYEKGDGDDDGYVCGLCTVCNMCTVCTVCYIMYRMYCVLCICVDCVYTSEIPRPMSESLSVNSSAEERKS